MRACGRSGERASVRTTWYAGGSPVFGIYRVKSYTESSLIQSFGIYRGIYRVKSYTEAYTEFWHIQRHIQSQVLSFLFFLTVNDIDNESTEMCARAH